jgi:hypothetical protein
MPKYTFVVMTNPKEGREQEYNDWYNKQHLADVLKVPGFVSAQRFKLASDQRAKTASPFKYVALYDIDTNDIAGSLAELGARAGTERMPISGAMADEKFTYVYEPIPRA